MDYGLLVSTYTRQLDGRKLTRQRLLYECLRSAILDGRIAQGSQLTATRTLAAELGMARNSVIYAYERLTAEGFVAPTRHGTTVARVGLARAGHSAGEPGRVAELSRRVGGLQRDRDGMHDLLPFVPGVPDLEGFPLAAWRRCVERAWRQMGPRHLGYGRIEGQPALRHAIAEYLKVSRGVRCEMDQVFITDGTQTSLDLCARMLADAGDTAWVENPGYGGARAAFQSAGLKLEPVPVDADGLAPRPGQWRDAPPRLIYITPSHQYPLGSILSLERRLKLIEDARAAGAWIIEDDYDSEFRRDGVPLSAVQGLSEDAPVIYLGTFSKTMFPALRLGFMVVPRCLATAVAGTLGELSRRGHVAEQVALADFIDSGQFARHLRRMRQRYSQRRDALQAALERHLRGSVTVSGSAGGMHLSARLALPLADTLVSRAAREQGLIVRPLSTYRLPGTPLEQYNGFVFGYAGVPASAIDGLIARLASVIASLQQGPAA
ncbi:PLP-dependent aminotransferase family protein [Cupriavidus basilensis]|uniref:PLP-dependent aminotransferase family protein n=1 Tax=Cupriavidus basilensis TaxID=68895 RepID=A0ABT6AZD6_9BURK|nr:PLP-dependent aminotransferase family protein [Cupriavidus basilensis]MDF3837071.1 PLP-dependent aminotransferase family protein [Cupriavidus basilensis]